MSQPEVSDPDRVAALHAGKPPVPDHQEQIGQLEKQIKDHVSTLLERELAKLRELQAEEQATGQTIKGMKSELEPTAGRRDEPGNLERDIDTKQAILSVLLKKYQDSLLAQNTDSAWKTPRS